MKPTRILAPVLTAAFVFLATAAHAAQPIPNAESARGVDFHVSPDGLNTNPGSRDQPFATLTRARDAVRAALGKNPAQNLTVELRGGIHVLSEPLVLGLQDSPGPCHRVSWQAAAGGSPK